MKRLKAIVLGAAAGGGFPQWNCRCAVCSLAWTHDPRVKPRTQSSIAVSADGERWVLLNASPDLRFQIQNNAALQPRTGLRSSPISAVLLTGAEIDQVTGLLDLRERQAFDLYASKETLASLADNPIFNALATDLVKRQTILLDHPFSPAPGLTAELFAVPGKVPLYLETDNPEIGAETGATVGVEIRANDARLVYVPGAAAMTAALHARLARASLIMFDGTLYTDDEMIRSGTGLKTGRRMGHMPIEGSDGSLAALTDVPGRRVYVHINNTNPILIAGSPERQRVEKAGWEVAEDGMEIVL
jgi:pyrroloquinoline quinone biosynthesis protein B